MRPAALLLVMLLCCPLASQAQGRPLRICNEDGDNHPYLIKGGIGLDNQQIDMAAKKAGLAVEQVALPWKRCFKELQEGTVDGVAAASYNEERAGFAQYPMTKNGELDNTRRLRNDSYSLFRAKNSETNWNGKQFTQLTTPVGAQFGYSVVSDLQKTGVDVQSSYYDAKLLMGQVVRGRIQLAAMLTKEGDVLATSPEFAGKIERINPVFVEKPYFVIFGKAFYASNKNAVEQFWGGIAFTRESAAYEALKKSASQK